MRRQLVYNLLIAFFCSILFSYIVYFGFVSAYTKIVFSEKSFLELYDGGIFKYRILSKELILFVNDNIEQYVDENPPDMSMRRAIDKEYSHSFYVSYFIVNTSFLVLSSFVFLFIMNLKQYLISEKEKLLYLLLFILIVSLSQFVVVPYDISSYFLLLLFIYYASLYFETHSANYILILSVITLVATLNRESSALTLSYFAAIYIIFHRGNRKLLTTLVFLIAIYFATYIGLRLFIENPDAYIWNSYRLSYNFKTLGSHIGLWVWALLFIITIRLSNEKINKRLIYYFHILSAPYIVLCVYTGLLFEVRLYIPLFIVSLLLTRYKPIHRIK